MGRNFDRWSAYRHRHMDGINDHLDRVPGRLQALRLRLRRSSNGLALGVFRGIAESCGFSVCWTRIIGCIGLLALSGERGHGNLLVAGFFYLLAAVLMGRPGSPSRLDMSVSGHLDPGDQEDASGHRQAPPPAPRVSARPGAVPSQQVVRSARVDFAALDRQLEVLNRRIQHMEGIVTDRHYDWDRRLES